jgi:alpha-beta hydrolase superfamily lysophospholipase
MVGIRCAALAVAVALPWIALAQAPAPCPKSLPEGAECWQGRDDNGSYYWIARPKSWNGVLVMHSHGGPRLSAPRPESEIEDLERFAVIVKEGYAFAAASYRAGGYIGLATAAEDTDNLRRIYVAKFGAPRRVIAHGQSWGGGVTAHLIERYGVASDGKPNYDAALLTSGIVAGNARAYDFRADLRAVYQHYCRNHPRPDEPPYPLWSGLPADSKLTPKELEARVDECTGVRTPAAKRTARQQKNLDNILAVLKIRERSLVGHMNWSTFLFRDIVSRRLGGGNPFTNADVRYAGSDDDDALNRGVERFRADAAAAEKFAADGRLTGKVSMPVLTLHAIDDPVVFVEQDAVYRDTLERGGSAGRLVQTWTREAEHSYLATPQYAALLEALMRWRDHGEKPSAESIAAACERQASRYPGGCHFDVEYRPKPLEARQHPR